ncbi:MAG: hypothetical protein ACOY90_01090 [Candidatus Zhuqueibacterota bacterium]
MMLAVISNSNFIGPKSGPNELYFQNNPGENAAARAIRAILKNLQIYEFIFNKSI